MVGVSMFCSKSRFILLACASMAATVTVPAVAAGTASDVCFARPNQLVTLEAAA